MPNRDSNRTAIIVNTALLCVACYGALVVSIWWNHWVQHSRPFAAILPVGLAMGVTAFAVVHHGVSALTAGSLRILEFAYWRRACLISALVSAAALTLSSGEVYASNGRVLAVAILAAITSLSSVTVAWTTRSFDGESFLRAMLGKRSVRMGLRCGAVLFAASLLIVAIEAACMGILNSRPPGPSKIYEGEYLGHGFSQWDDDLGTRLSPNQDIACRMKFDGETIWDVRYSTDEFGRRTTINSEADADKFAVFFGCSFLFGEGAEDSETIPSLFAESADGFRAYNYGVPGYGTQQMLAKLQSGTIRDEIPEQRGVVIYLYLEEVHEPRVIGGMQITSGSAWNFPYYVINNEDEVQRLGNFTSGRPVLSRIYSVLNRSNLVRLLGLNFPKRSADHYRLLARLVAESKAECDDQLGPCDFYVACFPRSDAHRKLLPHLDELGIRYLDYSDLFDPGVPENYHTGDGHPTPLANALLSEQLARDIH